MTMIRLLLALILVQQIAAFSPRTSTFTPASSVSGARPPSASVMKSSVILRMAEEKKEAPVVSADGTFYDDQMDSAPVKQGISDSMKQRLMREASTGLDSNQKQTNVIFYISIGVAVLVLLGGQGILY